MQGGGNKKCTKGNVTLPNKEQEQVLVAALAVEASPWRLLVAVSGSSSSSSRKIDVDKVRRVLEGKVAVQIVDVDVEPWTEMGRKVSDNCSDMCSIAAILEESMKSLTLEKK